MSASFGHTQTRERSAWSDFFSSILERTAEAVSAHVAHRLGTPLNVIVGRAQLLLERASDSEVDEHAKAILRKSDEVARFLGDLTARRDAAIYDAAARAAIHQGVGSEGSGLRPRDGTREAMEPDRVPLRLVFDDARRILAPLADAQGLSFAFQPGPDLWCLGRRSDLVLLMVLTGFGIADVAEARTAAPHVVDIGAADASAADASAADASAADASAADASVADASVADASVADASAADASAADADARALGARRSDARVQVTVTWRVEPPDRHGISQVAISFAARRALLGWTDRSGEGFDASGPSLTSNAGASRLIEHLLALLGASTARDTMEGGGMQVVVRLPAYST